MVAALAGRQRRDRHRRDRRARRRRRPTAHGHCRTWKPSTNGSPTRRGCRPLAAVTCTSSRSASRSATPPAALGAGLDIRGRGGYVVAPPSLHHTGWRYRWHDLDIGLAAVPSWLAESLRPAPARDRATSSFAPLSGDALRARRARRRAGSHRDLAAAHAQRHRQPRGVPARATRRRRARRPRGARRPTAEAALAVGQGEREARATIASGLTAGVANPRRVRRHHQHAITVVLKAKRWRARRAVNQAECGGRGRRTDPPKGWHA